MMIAGISRSPSRRKASTRPRHRQIIFDGLANDPAANGDRHGAYGGDIVDDFPMLTLFRDLGFGH